MKLSGIWVLFLLVYSLFSACPDAWALEKNHKYRIIILETMPVKKVIDHQNLFMHYMAEHGYKEGVNMEYVILKAEGDAARAERLLSEALAKGTPDLVVSNATMASKVAKKLLSGTTIAQVFITVSDPVGAGLITEKGVATGGNITGVLNELDKKKKIRMVVDTLEARHDRKPIRMGYIHSSYPSSVGDIREMMSIVEGSPDIVFVPYEIPYRKVPEELDTMIKDVRKAMKELQQAGSVDYWWEPSGPLGESPEYTKTLLEHSDIPIVYGHKMESVAAGALLHIAPDPKAVGEMAAHLALDIMEGKSPGELAPLAPPGFRIGVNITTAQRLGIAFPSSIITLAGEHIYR